MGKYTYNKDYFKEIDSFEKAYWLGFLYADGCITRFYKDEKLKSMSLEITLQNDDKNHLIKFRDALDSNVPIKDKLVAGKYKSSRIVINCTGMCNDLINLGCTPQKSIILEFPKNNILPEKYINDFVRGYFDGDGGVSYTEGTYYSKARGKNYKQRHYRCYFCGNKHFLQKIKDILNSNGINTSDLKEDNRGKAVNLYIYGKDNIEKLKHFLYTKDCVCLSRKFEKFNDIENNSSLHINR